MQGLQDGIQGVFAKPGPAAQAVLDGEYYEVAKPGSIAERVLFKARNRIYEDFARLCRPVEGDTILDVGVSDTITDAANVLERLHPWPQAITAVGLGDGQSFREAYPEVSYRQIKAGARLPFADQAFRIATSNAVLEHVGSRAAQVAFLGELLRVAGKVFITVPNRYFPVEHHTGIPFAHWTGRSFSIACRALRKGEWTDPERLILMSRAYLAGLVRSTPTRTRPTLGYTGLPMGPFSSNLYVFCQSERSWRSNRPPVPATTCSPHDRA